MIPWGRKKSESRSVRKRKVVDYHRNTINALETVKTVTSLLQLIRRMDPFVKKG